MPRRSGESGAQVVAGFYEAEWKQSRMGLDVEFHATFDRISSAANKFVPANSGRLKVLEGCRETSSMSNRDLPGPMWEVSDTRLILIPAGTNPVRAHSSF